MDASLSEAKKAELTTELRRARGWILAVGIIMAAMDQILLRAVYAGRVPASWITTVTLIDAAILGVFVALWWFAQYRPKLCCALALVAFWGLHLTVAALYGGQTLTQGIILKILFTVALVNGLKSASRAETLQKELENVFG